MPDQVAEGLLSPYLRTKRLQAASPYLKGRILDFGCGTGALAAFVKLDQYLGVERDSFSLQQAKRCFPRHRFVSKLTASSGKFDTIISLAVIEHIADPAVFLKTLVGHLKNNPFSRIIITTPHPTVGRLHDWGSIIGLFSKHANEEHKELLGRAKLATIGEKTGLKLSFYTRFLLGTNQLAVYSASDE